MLSSDDLRPSDLDMQQFEQLVGRESVTWAGQELKMRAVRGMIKQRIDTLMGGVTPSDLRYHEVRLANGKTQLIVGRGEQRRHLSKRQQTLNVLVPSHIDTVALQSLDLLKLVRNPKNPDEVNVRGGYDMLGQELNSIALSPVVRVPRGMNVFFASTFDEERNSLGAQAVIDPKSWEWWPDIDIVLSSEIGHVPVEKHAEGTPYIVGRRGRLKYHLTLTVDEAARGHFADRHVRSAKQAIAEAIYLLINRFNRADIQVAPNIKPLKKKHAHLDEERLEFGSGATSNTEELLLSELEQLLQTTGDIRSQLAQVVQKRRSDLELRDQPSTPPTQEEIYYSIQSVVGRKTSDSLREQRTAIDQIAKHCEWRDHGISWTLTANERETSYEAFELPPKHPLNTVVERILARIGKPGLPVHAPSVADENLYAAAILSRPSNNGVFRPYQGVISIPPLGDNAHRIDEWVSLTSLMRSRHAIRSLIEDEDGLIKLRDMKRYRRKY
jgi:acetylornithine deacetylase/succinyl-diaminopimelate desuccinylase-like protein